MQVEAVPELFLVVARRDEVEANQTARVLRILKGFLKPNMIDQAMFHLEFCVHGYDDDPRELCEIPEVRRYVTELDRQWPYWFAFCHPEGLSLMFLTFSLCPYRMHPKGVNLQPEVLKRFMISKFDAVGRLADQELITEKQLAKVTNKVYRYYLTQMV